MLDQRIRATTLLLRRWSAAKIGSIAMQLAMSREVILVLEIVQESRSLMDWELNLCKTLKIRVLGLSSFLRTIVHQRARIRFLAEGDANTKFYHL